MNVDFPGNKNKMVFPIDLCKKWPFDADSLVAIYSSHFLEHLPFHDAVKILKSCFTSLKKNGVFRVCVPNLEYNAKLYLRCLTQYKKTKKNIENLNWARLNLFEQMVRSEPGGEIARLLLHAEPKTLRFIAGTTGGPEAYQANVEQRSKRPRTLRRIFTEILKKPENNVKPEKHRWAYDGIQLSQMLADTGFVQIKQKLPGKTLIRGWREPGIEIHQDGKEWKPNSLILEAIKP